MGHIVVGGYYSSPDQEEEVDKVWWVDLGWPPGALQATLPVPLLNWTGGKNAMKGLWVEVRTGRSVSNYRHGQNRLNLGKLV